MATIAATNAIDERREFVRALDDRVGVSRTDFTRDGFETVFVEFEAGEPGFRDVVDDALDLGYEFGRVGPRLYRFELRD